MKKLTDSQIEFIINEINKSVFSSTTLREDLTDHFCCTVEDEINKGNDFESAYKKAFDRICPEGIDKIGKETLFLMPLKSRKRLGRFVNISGIMAFTGIVITFIMKILHLPYAQIIFLLTALISITFCSALFANVLRNSTGMRKFSSAFGVAGLTLMALSAIFKLLHWPGTIMFLVVSIILCYIAIFPLFFVKMHRKI